LLTGDCHHAGSSCLITVLPVLNFEQTQVAVMRTNSHWTNFSIASALNGPAASAFTAQLTMNSTLAGLVTLDAPQFASGAMTGVLHLEALHFLPVEAACSGGTVSITLNPSDNYLVGVNNTITISFSTSPAPSPTLAAGCGSHTAAAMPLFLEAFLTALLLLLLLLCH